MLPMGSRPPRGVLHVVELEAAIPARVIVTLSRFQLQHVVVGVAEVDGWPLAPGAVAAYHLALELHALAAQLGGDLGEVVAADRQADVVDTAARLARRR